MVLNNMHVIGTIIITQSVYMVLPLPLSLHHPLGCFQNLNCLCARPRLSAQKTQEKHHQSVGGRIDR